MSSDWNNGISTVLIGDVRERMAEIPDRSVQCVVTSPPYYGLRDYGTARWDGGDTGCDHVKERTRRTDRDRSGLTGSLRYNDSRDMPYMDICGKCGAKRVDDQIGLEQTPQEYVAEMVAVFREVRRVLKDDGTLWLNIGDSYASSGTSGHQNLDVLGERLGTGGGHKNSAILSGRAPTPDGLKPKDLIGIPWRVALALQDDGWYLRQDIIWNKPNAMPESVKDRCTKSHEYLFLLTKNARYYFDKDAMREKAAGPGKAAGRKNDASRNDSNRTGIVRGDGLTRNRRSVWTIATRPYKGAHFAVFPPQLIEPCILAGSREGDTVFDPFAGSGTALAVAEQLGRKGLGVELNPDYLPLIQKRMLQRPLKKETR